MGADGAHRVQPALRGRGIGRSALAQWTTYLFERTDWVRLDFATWSGNSAMIRVGQALGFTEEARFRDARIVRGEYFDSVVMGVIRAEWDLGIGLATTTERRSDPATSLPHNRPAPDGRSHSSDLQASPGRAQ